MIRIIFITILCVSLNYADTLIVPSDKFATISSAVDSASQGDTILVMPGIYKENINFSGKAIMITSNFSLSGNDNDIENTIIDGNSSSVVVEFESGEDSTSALNGFTIRNGYNYPGGGGGISCINMSSPKLTNLIITDNIAANGGGIFCFNNSDPILKNVIISENGAVNSGGGILLDRNCSIRMENVSIVGNVANQDGGGIYLKDSSGIIIKQGKIHDNIGDWSGGGIFATMHSIINLSNIEILNNETSGNGGGLNIISCDLDIFRGLISGNLAYDGAALSCSNNSHVYLLNTTVTANQVIPGDGPIEIGGLLVDHSNIDFANSILWSNSGLEMNMLNSHVTIAYSNIEEDSLQIEKDTESHLFWLEKNISDSPLFIDADFNDFRLTENSPCIDAGIQDKILIYNNGQDSLNIPILNFIGEHPDMGMFEYGDPTSISASKFITMNYQLHQNYPNPFNPQTTIGFTIPERQFVRLEIFNVLGQPVEVLINGSRDSGNHEVVFDGTRLASGIYYYRITAGQYNSIKKMLLVR
jgi:parallel beta-helix repeat protein